MFGFGMQELLVILAIVLLIFGPKRLKNIGADLGNAIKGFRTAVSDGDKAAETSDAAASVIDGDGTAVEATTQSSTTAKQEKK